MRTSALIAVLGVSPMRRHGLGACIRVVSAVSFRIQVLSRLEQTVEPEGLFARTGVRRQALEGFANAKRCRTAPAVEAKSVRSTRTLLSSR